MNQLLFAALLLAEDAAPAANPGGPPGWTQIVFLWGPMLLLIWFFFLRPMNRERARQQALLAAVKKNDRVLTSSGIIGVVTNVSKETNEVTLRIDESTNTKIRMTLSSVTQVLGDEPAAETPAK